VNLANIKYIIKNNITTIIDRNGDTKYTCRQASSNARSTIIEEGVNALINDRASTMGIDISLASKPICLLIIKKETSAKMNLTAGFI
jgi:hypothetical protein